MSGIARLMQMASAGQFDNAWTLNDPRIPDYGILNVFFEDTQITDTFFKPDGTKVYITGRAGRDVNEYNLSTAWDISTASYVQNFSVAAEEVGPEGVFFKPDGTKMYIVGVFGVEINEYSLSTAWDISTASYVQNFSVATQETTPQGLFFKPDGTKVYVIGSTGDDVNEYTLSTAWDISTASYVQNFSVATEETAPSGLFFKPDGTKMYVVGVSGDDVNEYNLSTAWDISTTSYVQNFSVATEDSSPSGVFFKEDGTKMYITGGNSARVYAYTLSIAWDISTAFLDVPLETLSVATEESVPQGIFFKPDGTKVYVVGASGDAVNEYNLSTAWKISTATYVQNFSVVTEDINPSSLFFKPDGTKMYVIGSTGDDVNEYTLSTAWDISTASYVQNFSLLSETSAPTGVFFKPDGTKMYITGTDLDAVLEYNLSTAWDISTAFFPPFGKYPVLLEELTPTGVSFKPDGTKMYVIGSSGDNVNEYNLSTAWDISTASYVQNFSLSPQETNSQDLFFKPDGTKMYVIGSTGDDVNEYTLSTAWDISTASYVQNFSVAAQDSSPSGVFFKEDGTKMYVLGTIGDDINEYSLSTAWDVTTATYVQNFSVATEDVNPSSLFFKPDGTKVYVLGNTADAVYEYNLSTAWDISTTSYVQNFSVLSQDNQPLGIFFKTDGTKMYIAGATSDSVFQYSLSTPWDISTASWDAPVDSYFSVAAEETTPQGLFFKPDGTKMYVIGSSGDNVNEYNLSTAWDISTASYVQNFSVAAEDSLPTDVFFKPDGTQMYVVGSNFRYIWSYTL